MTQKLTELIFILDRSGSMGGLEGDTIGGFNAMLKKQKKLPGSCNVTTVLFDDRYQLLHDRAKLSEVAPLTEEDYFVRGSTALLDAMGKTIQRAGNLQKHLGEHEKASQVVVVVITDGQENASREFSYRSVKDMVNRQQERFGWEFLFLGANMDATAAAADIGIRRDRSARYHADARGTQLNYEVLDKTINAFRSAQPLDSDWMKEIDADYRNRKEGQ